MSYLQVLDPERSQSINLSFMQSNVKIDDNKYDIFELAPESQT